MTRSLEVTDIDIYELAIDTRQFSVLPFVQWNLPKERNFKTAVADSVTTFCAEIEDCITKHRKRFRIIVIYFVYVFSAAFDL